MSVVKHDIAEKGRQYTQKYALNTVEGVKLLLADRHRIGERRFRGDTAASDILIDLDNAIWRAFLTDRQAEAIAYVYGLDMTQTDAAAAMGVTQQAVEQFVQGAAKRIARVYRKWNYGEIEVTYEGSTP